MAQQPIERQQEDSDVLQAVVAGGLNIVDTALTIPAQDSPLLLNVDVEPDGGIVKRRGFSNEPDFPLTDNITSFVPLQLKNGYNVILHDDGTNQYVSYRDTNVASTASTWRTVTMLDVYGTDSALKYTTDVVISNEPRYTRVILLRPYHIPIQLLCIECSGQINPGAPTNVFTIDVPNLFADVIPAVGNLWCWVDGVFNPVTNYSYLSPSGTVTVSNAIAAGTHTIHLAYFTFQWWTEGNVVRGDQVIQHVTQGTTEIHKAVPARLLFDIDEATGYGVYPIKVYSSTVFDAVYSRVANLNPTVANEYAFSLGADRTAGTATIPSPFYVTFGAAPATSRGVIFHRAYSLKNYNNGKLVLNDHLTVKLYNRQDGWVLDSTSPPSEGGAGTGISPRFGFRTFGPAFTVLNAAQRATYIGFDGTASAAGGVSIPQDDLVLYGVYFPYYSASILGSGVTSVYTNIREVSHQAPYPIFGIQDFCSFSAGGQNGSIVSFPSTGCIYQRRMALAGMPAAPTTIAFSEVEDVTIPGQPYRNFQTTLEDGSATNGFILTLPTENNERIVAMREFQGNLFVWTNLSLYRVTGIQGAPFSDGATSISKLATVGCISPRCVCGTSNSLYWLSKTGVYAIRPDDTAGGYSIREISEKIRPLFLNGMNAYPELAAHLTYDSAEQRLYVGYPSNRAEFYNTSIYGFAVLRAYESDTLLVYHEFRDAWTQYTNSGGLNLYTRGSAVAHINTKFSNATNESVGSSTLYLYGADTGGGVSIGKQPRYIDQTDVITGLSGTQTATSQLHRVRVWTTTANRFTYDPADVVIGDTYPGIKLTPVVNLEDCIVYYNGNRLTFEVDYIKTNEGAIQLLFNPPNGQQLYMMPGQRINGSVYPCIGAYKNDEPLLPGVDYTISEVPVPVASFPGLVVSDEVRVGVTYPSFHMSPSFTRSTMVNWKSIKNWTGYYDNAFLGEKWKASNVGTRYDLIGLNKNYTNFDLIFVYNNETDGYITSEVYGASQLSWDEAALSLGTGTAAYKQYARLSIMVIGGGYAFSFMHFSNSVNAFKLSGYQIQAQLKPGKGHSRT